MDSPQYSVVIPVYKSQDSLRELYHRIRKVFETLGEEYELILVEDCGSDNSWQVMKSLRNEDRKVRIIRFMKNYGQHSALMCGLEHARGKFIITMDDDLQHPPEEIPKLITKMNEGSYDVVCGSVAEKKHSMLKNIGSFIFCRLISLQYNPSFRTASFRILRREVIDYIVAIKAVKPMLDILILKVTNNICYVEVEHHQRRYNTSTYTSYKLVRHFLNGIIYYTLLPLKAVFAIGAMCSVLSFVMALYYLIRYLEGKITISGWTTLVLLLLFFFGIITSFLGIIGEYLYRIIQHIGQIPPYTIREKDI